MGWKEGWKGGQWMDGWMGRMLHRCIASRISEGPHAMKKFHGHVRVDHELKELAYWRGLLKWHPSSCPARHQPVGYKSFSTKPLRISPLPHHPNLAHLLSSHPPPPPPPHSLTTTSTTATTSTATTTTTTTEKKKKKPTTKKQKPTTTTTTTTSTSSSTPCPPCCLSRLPRPSSAARAWNVVGMSFVSPRPSSSLQSSPPS